MRRITLALLTVIAAFGQSSQPLVMPSVAGRVLRQNGDVALRVTVSLVGPERYTVISDARGAFAFGGVAPGRYSLIAQRAGYASVKYGGTTPLSVNCVGIDLLSWTHAGGGDDQITTFRNCIDRAPGVALTVTPGLELKDLTIRIAQTSVIRGTVTNQDADAVPGTMTALVRDPGARTLRTVTTASIGQDGKYTVDDLTPGRYYLLARSAGTQMLGIAIVNGAQVLMNQGPAGAAPSESEVATYYPSETDDSKAVPVEVRAGDELRGVDVLMRRSRVFSVRGTLVMPAGPPPANTLLTLTQKGGGIYSTSRAVAGADGTFEFRGVAPGAYMIMCAAQGLSAVLDVAVAAADVDGLKLTMAPASPIMGTLKMEGPVPKAWPTVTLTAVDGSASGTLKVEADGTFRVPANPPPVEFEMRLGALPSGAYMKSIRYAGQEAPGGRVDFTSGQGNIEIVLATDSASVRGKVTTAAGTAPLGAQLTVWPRTSRAGGVKSGNADQIGEFEIEGLAPGDYFVAAWENISGNLADDPSFLNRFQGAAAAVSVAANGRASADVKLIPREAVDAEIAKLR